MQTEANGLSPRSLKNSKVMKTVLRYFVRNPHMTDTLEGIVRWRLLDEALLVRVVETEAALHELVDAGYLLREDRPGTERLYRLNAAAVDAAAQLADTKAPPATPAPLTARPRRRR